MRTMCLPQICRGRAEKENASLPHAGLATIFPATGLDGNHMKKSISSLPLNEEEMQGAFATANAFFSERLKQGECNMLDIFIKTHFSGGHHLRRYPGNCEKPHGHNWKVRVTVRATKLDALGMGIDFKVLKDIVKQAVDELDHTDLNEHPAFREVNPSSEHIAMHIFAELKNMLTTDRYALYSVTVRETDSSGVTYYGE